MVKSTVRLILIPINPTKYTKKMPLKSVEPCQKSATTTNIVRSDFIIYYNTHRWYVLGTYNIRFILYIIVNII